MLQVRHMLPSHRMLDTGVYNMQDGGMGLPARMWGDGEVPSGVVGPVVHCGDTDMAEGVVPAGTGACVRLEMMVEPGPVQSLGAGLLAIADPGAGWRGHP